MADPIGKTQPSMAGWEKSTEGGKLCFKQKDDNNASTDEIKFIEDTPGNFVYVNESKHTRGITFTKAEASAYITDHSPTNSEIDWHGETPLAAPAVQPNTLSSDIPKSNGQKWTRSTAGDNITLQQGDTDGQKGFKLASTDKGETYILTGKGPDGKEFKKDMSKQEAAEYIKNNGTENAAPSSNDIPKSNDQKWTKSSDGDKITYQQGDIADGQKGFKLASTDKGETFILTGKGPDGKDFETKMNKEVAAAYIKNNGTENVAPSSNDIPKSNGQKWTKSTDGDKITYQQGDIADGQKGFKLASTDKGKTFTLTSGDGKELKKNMTEQEAAAYIKDNGTEKVETQSNQAPIPLTAGVILTEAEKKERSLPDDNCDYIRVGTDLPPRYSPMSKGEVSDNDIRGIVQTKFFPDDKPQTRKDLEHKLNTDTTITASERQALYLFLHGEVKDGKNQDGISLFNQIENINNKSGKGIKGSDVKEFPQKEFDKNMNILREGGEGVITYLDYIETTVPGAKGTNGNRPNGSNGVFGACGLQQLANAKPGDPSFDITHSGINVDDRQKYIDAAAAVMKHEELLKNVNKDGMFTKKDLAKFAPIVPSDSTLDDNARRH